MCDDVSAELILNIILSACLLKRVANEMCFEQNLIAWLGLNFDVKFANGTKSLENTFMLVMIELRKSLKMLGSKCWKSMRIGWLACANKMLTKISYSDGMSVFKEFENDVKDEKTWKCVVNSEEVLSEGISDDDE